MTMRLRILLGIMCISAAATGAYWLWSATAGPAPMDALRLVPGPVYIVRVQPVANESIDAFVELYMLDATRPIFCRACVKKWLQWH